MKEIKIEVFTAATAEKVRTEIYRRMSPKRKWEEAFNLREIAWKVKAAAIRALHPDWDEQTIESVVRETFLYAVT